MTTRHPVLRPPANPARMRRHPWAGPLAALLLATTLPVISAAESPGPDPRRPPDQRSTAGRWVDAAHGHNRAYPVTGWRTHALPVHGAPRVWGGGRYWFASGIWYAPFGSGYAVVRPPLGIVVDDLPSLRSMVVIGGITYLYLNGVYYRPRGEGGYEVVASPLGAQGTPSGAPGRQFVYPAQGQSAEQQATDEYECHRWAVVQSGFNPVPGAGVEGSSSNGGDGAAAGDRADYARAQAACLTGRGYTVR